MRLEQLRTALVSLRDKLSSINGKKFSEKWGANIGPALTTSDLSKQVSALVLTIDSVDWSATSEDDISYLNAFAQTIDSLQGVVQNIFNANNQHSPVAIAVFISSLESILASKIGTNELKASLALPTRLQRKVTVAQQRLEQANLSLEDIDIKLKHIDDAYEAAENLPKTQQDLKDALDELVKTKKSALEHELSAKKSAEESESKMKELEALKKQAEAVIKNINDVYRAATSQGLAQAFKAKQDSLNQSMAIWVVLLLISLACAALIGHVRFPAILNAISKEPQWGIVGINIAISALSIAPAVWFGWMATKQIGQRFRLAEDYGYKAALATAYEGYRNEAARLDPIFEAQLFATALGRLDEIPLRLVEPDAPGSPMHELFKSQEFKSAIATVPGLKDNLVSLLKRFGIKDGGAKTPAASGTSEA